MEKKQDKILAIFCIFLFFSTYLILFYLDKHHKPEITKIPHIDSSYLNKQVTIEGKVLRQRIGAGHLFITIQDENSSMIEGVAFYAGEELRTDINYFFSGRISLRDSKLQIIIDRAKPSPK